MRKDIFIVGARLLGIWLLVGALNPLAYVIARWFVTYQSQPYTLEYNIVSGLVHIITGLYLLLKTNSFFDFLERVLPEEASKKEEENSVA